MEGEFYIRVRQSTNDPDIVFVEALQDKQVFQHRAITMTEPEGYSAAQWVTALTRDIAEAEQDMRIARAAKLVLDYRKRHPKRDM